MRRFLLIATCLAGATLAQAADAPGGEGEHDQQGPHQPTRIAARDTGLAP